MKSDEAVVHAMSEAVNQRDLEALLTPFSPSLEIRFPCHPRRPAVGYEQLRTAWRANFANVQELRSMVTAVQKGNEVWSEWQWSGKRDEEDWNVRGVIIWIRQEAGRTPPCSKEKGPGRHISTGPEESCALRRARH